MDASQSSLTQLISLKVLDLVWVPISLQLLLHQFNWLAVMWHWILLIVLEERFGQLRLFPERDTWSNCNSFHQILLGVSSGGTGFFLGVMGIYSYLDHTGIDLSHVKFIPIMSLSLVIFVASVGIITLPFIVLAEISPQKVS